MRPSRQTGQGLRADLDISRTSELGLLTGLLGPQVVARGGRDGLAAAGGQSGIHGHPLAVLVREHEHLLEAGLARGRERQYLHSSSYIKCTIFFFSIFSSHDFPWAGKRERNAFQDHPGPDA